MSKLACAISIARRRLVAVMDAAQRLELRAIEALDADRQAVDAAVAVRPELVRLEGAGIGFHA